MWLHYSLGLEGAKTSAKPSSRLVFYSYIERYMKMCYEKLSQEFVFIQQRETQIILSLKLMQNQKFPHRYIYRLCMVSATMYLPTRASTRACFGSSEKSLVENLFFNTMDVAEAFIVAFLAG